MTEAEIKNRAYDAATVELLRRVLGADSSCLDVGANRGSILKYMVELAPAARHLAFEPVPALARRLRRDFPTVDVRAVALGCETGVRDFYHVLTAHTRSGLRAEHLGGAHKVVKIHVPVARLDDVVPDRPIRAIKVDVEGGEYDVFVGARNTILRWRPTIAFEFGAAALSFGVSPDRLFDLLTDELGMAVFDIGAWLAGHQPLSRPAFCADRGEFFFVAAPTESAGDSRSGSR